MVPPSTFLSSSFQSEMEIESPSSQKHDVGEFHAAGFWCELMQATVTADFIGHFGLYTTKNTEHCSFRTSTCQIIF